MSEPAPPTCRLCGSPMQPGSDASRHIIPETCIRKLADRLEGVERALRAFLPGDRDSSRALEPADAGGLRR